MENKKKIMAIDAGYANVGLVIMEYRMFTNPLQRTWWPIDMACIQTEPAGKKVGLRKSDDHARRIAESSRRIAGYVRKHEIKSMVVELPPAGSGNPNVARTLAFAGGMIAAVEGCLDLMAEYYTPAETRAAAGVPLGVKDKDNVKKIVMAEMGRRYPELDTIFTSADRRNHVADALATFEAARGSNLVRMMEDR